MFVWWWVVGCVCQSQTTVRQPPADFVVEYGQDLLDWTHQAVVEDDKSRFSGFFLYLLVSNSILYVALFFGTTTHGVQSRRTDLMALDCSPDLFTHRFYVLVLFFCFSYS